MTKSSHEPDITLLSKAKSGLAYLTANDWALLADKAVRQQFKPGEALVQRAKATSGIYILLKGTASAQIPGQMAGRHIGPGEVCGEISFIDGSSATATVVAVDPVDAYYLEGKTLQSMFELFPHLGSRFYHSLSAIVARRLRELINSQALSAATAAPEKAPLAPAKSGKE